MASFATHKLGVKVAEHPPDGTVAQITPNVHKELQESISNGGTREISEAITPAHPGAGVYHHQTITVPTRRLTVSKADIHAQSVANGRNLGFPTTTSTLDVHKIANTGWRFPQIDNVPPLSHLGKKGPIENATVAKQFVEFLTGVGVCGRRG